MTAGGKETTADLAALRIWIKRRRLHIWGRLNTLYDNRSTVLAVAIGRPRSRGGRWPGLNVSSSGWSKVFVLRGGDPATNVIQGGKRITRRRQRRKQAVNRPANRNLGRVWVRGPS